MTTYNYGLYPIWQFYNNGAPVAGGKLFTYIAGTTTKQSAYADNAGTALSNPIILDSQGRPTTNGTTITPVFLQVGQSYKFVLAPSTDTDPPSSPIWTADNQSTTTLITNIANTGFGQCRLSVTSTTVITLSPYNGNLLTINDATYQIPNAGITLSNSGLSASTLYYIYAYMNGTTMTLEASATAYSAGGTARMMTKTGDTTRTLVGMIRVDAFTQFVDDPAHRLLANWFNRQPKSIFNIFTTNRTTTSATITEVNSEIRASFVNWASTIIPVFLQSNVSNSAAADAGTGLLLDGSSAPYAISTATVAMNALFPMYTSTFVSPSEGLHYITLGAYTASGTLTCYSNANAGAVCEVGGTLLI